MPPSHPVPGVITATSANSPTQMVN